MKTSRGKGMVLVITLWLIATLAVFGIGLARISWSERLFARWKVNNFFARHAVNAVILMSKRDRMDDETSGYDTLSELAREGEYACGNFKVIYSLIDEERKININTASSSVLKNLPSMDMDKAVAAVNSAFRPFFPKQELLLVDEIDEEDYAEIKDLTTVHGEGQVNINTCSEETLEMLGMKQDLIARVMEFRKGEDGELYTEDDGRFESAGGIVSSLKEEAYLASGEELALVSLISKNMLGVKGANYRIEADVYVNEKLVDSYSVVIGKDAKSEKYSIKEWGRK